MLGGVFEIMKWGKLMMMMPVGPLVGLQPILTGILIFVFSL